MTDQHLDEYRNIINQYFEWKDYPDENGWRYVLCANIVLYFEGFQQPLKSNRQGILDFYDRSMELVKGDMKWVQINAAGHFRKITKKVFDMIPFWVSPEGPDKGILGVDMQGGPEKNGRIDKGFSFYHFDRSCLCLTLPVEYMLDDPQRFADLAKSMTSHLKFVSGNAGFAVSMYPDGGVDREEGSHIYMLSRRFDGLDLGAPRDSAFYAIHGLRTINWLTFVGDGLAGRMNGRDGVKAALPQHIPFTDLDHGLMIQAGPKPILGDVNLQENMSDYYRVGRALKPLTFPMPIVSEFHRTYPYAIGGQENSERWHKRFFEGQGNT